jgi:putative transposase
MIIRAHKLLISRQAELLGISRGSVYYLPRPVSENDLTIMRRLDELHLRYPFMGTLMLRDQLNRQGIDIGRKHVSTLMKKININASLIRARNNQDTRFILIY